MNGFFLHFRVTTADHGSNYITFLVTTRSIKINCYV